MADRYAGKTVVAACVCGWRQEAPASSGGMTIECPRCKAAVNLPLFGPDLRADLSPAEQAALEALAGRRFARRVPPRAALLFFGGVLCGAAIACAVFLTRPEFRAGGALLCGLPGAWLILRTFKRR